MIRFVFRLKAEI